MIDSPYYAILAAAGCYIIGLLLTFLNGSNIEKVWGVIILSLGNLLIGALLMLGTKGIPVKMNDINRLFKIQLEKKIDQSLSLVKTANGDDRRVVKDIPAEVREGDVFMIMRDGSVVILKTPLNPSPIGDRIGGY